MPPHHFNYFRGRVRFYSLNDVTLPLLAEVMFSLPFVSLKPEQLEKLKVDFVKFEA